MKKRFYIIAALCVMAVGMALWFGSSPNSNQSRHQEFVIRITGTKGLRADGIISVTINNQTKDESFTLEVPWEERVTADYAAAGFQKLSPDGVLKIQLLDEKGKIIHESETSVRYGVAFVTSDGASK